MTTQVSLITLLLTSVWLVACTLQLDPEETKVALENRWQAFSAAWEAKNAEGCANFYTLQGQNKVGDNDPEIGRLAITDFYRQLFSENLSGDYNHYLDSIRIEGETVTEFGQFEVEWTRNDSTSWYFKANSTTTWVKGSQKEWEIEKFHFIPVEQH